MQLSKTLNTNLRCILHGKKDAASIDLQLASLMDPMKKVAETDKNVMLRML